MSKKAPGTQSDRDKPAQEARFDDKLLDLGRKSQAANKKPLAVRDRDFPVTPWFVPRTGLRFQTVTVRLDDGQFLSVIAQEQEIRRVARTRRAAERAVTDFYACLRHR